eukprot:TRINITY_DN86_c0_g1_i1.p1 TRINITY_DN86_c0_g1~~TRINITY_DN86_c0_g1_i1.p1  ORF type:complete len:967 (-),score=426.63 TRINITY_DN86_c0_g1_i1:213-3059(-)
MASEAKQAPSEKKYEVGQALVKAVLSGDTIVLLGNAQPNGVQPERTITISGIIAPRFSRSKNAVDEPFGWHSREFLRKKIVGQRVAFRILHKQGDREYGNIMLNNEDISTVMVANGWAKARVPAQANPDTPIPPEREALMKLEEEAQSQNIGIWVKNINPRDYIRNINYTPDARSLYEQCRGRSVPAVVEQVRDGSTFKVEFAAEGMNHYSIVLHLAGVQCPRVPLPLSVLEAQYKQAMEENPDAKLEPPREEKAGPYAIEAKLFSENRLLHRDVGLRIEGIDKSGNFFGTLQFPQGNITFALLKNGLGKSVQWSAALTADPAQIQAHEQMAKDAGLRLWAGYVAPLNSAPSANKKDFLARVLQVLSGDCMVIEDATGAERKIYLSSIRAPRLARNNEQPYGREAQECLRKKLVGKRVQVVVEYIRAVTDINNRTEDRVFAAVLHNKQNIAESLVADGFAEVQRHRPEEDRSVYYDQLLEAEANAIRGKKGLHSGRVPPVHPVIDLSERFRPSASMTIDEKEEAAKQARLISAKAKQYYPFLTKEKQARGVVEHVFSGSRLKVLIPKENCMLSFALSGIKCPQTARPGPNGASLAAEPYSNEAYQFTRKLTLQHDVIVEIEAMDKGDNYIGTLFSGRQNLAVELLKAGLAQVVPFSAEKCPYREELFAAEAEAKNARLNVWKNWVEPVASDEKKEEEKKELDLTGQFLPVKVTEVTDACTFYIQMVNDEGLALVEERMAEFGEVSRPPIVPFRPKKGSVCAGLFSDGGWYRVRCEGRGDEGGVRVHFIDYGNRETLTDDCLRPLDGSYAQLAQAPPLALACVLSGCKAPAPDSEFSYDCTQALSSMTMGRELLVRIDLQRDRDGKMAVTLWENDGEEEKDSINQVMIREGWVRVDPRADRRLPADLMALLRQDEATAKKKRYNIWTYGDVYDDEEESPAAGNSRPRRN